MGENVPVNSQIWIDLSWGCSKCLSIMAMAVFSFFNGSFLFISTIVYIMLGVGSFSFNLWVTSWQNIFEPSGENFALPDIWGCPCFVDKMVDYCRDDQVSIKIGKVTTKSGTSLDNILPLFPFRCDYISSSHCWYVKGYISSYLSWLKSTCALSNLFLQFLDTDNCKTLKRWLVP